MLSNGCSSFKCVDSKSDVNSHYFQPEETQASDALFDRIADSFVALFVSIHPDLKDKFLNVRLPRDATFLLHSICYRFTEVASTGT